MCLVMWRWIRRFEMSGSDFGGSAGCVSLDLIHVIALCVTLTDYGGRFFLPVCYGDEFK